MPGTTFFSSGPCADAEYEEVRDSPATACKEFVENLWQAYEPYKSDDHFLSDARSHFHQRLWEMYLCVSMVKRGFVIEKGGKVGPEFSTMIGGNRVWFEAIAPSAGTGEDQVEANQNWTPHDKILMRYTAAFTEKFRKYQLYREKGIIGPTDGFVIAINANKVPHAYFGSYAPYPVQAFLSVGAPTVVIDTQTMKQVGSYYQERSSVKKTNNSKVETKAFLDPKYAGVSAILHSTFGVAAYTHGTARWGDNFEILHNPLSANPLQVERFRWCTQQFMRGDNLETLPAAGRVESDPVTADNPSVRELKAALADSEWLRDPDGKAIQEAHKALDEFRQASRSDGESPV